jgi:hypothetical protein
MAHHEEQPTAIESVLEVLSEPGLGAMSEAMQTLLNEAMKLERSEFLPAAPGERTDERTQHAAVPFGRLAGCSSSRGQPPSWHHGSRAAAVELPTVGPTHPVREDRDAKERVRRNGCRSARHRSCQSCTGPVHIEAVPDGVHASGRRHGRTRNAVLRRGSGKADQSSP